MRWRTTLILALLLGGVSIFYYVYEIRLAPDREKAASQKDRLFVFEGKDVEAITLKRKSDSVRLRREGEGWVLVEPVSSKADKGPVEDLVSSFSTAKIEREVDAKPEKLSDYGLAPATAEITLNVKGKAEPITLLLGERSPTRVWVYAKTAEKPAVVLLSDTLLRDATKRAEEFRDKTILAMELKEITGLELRSRGEELAAELSGGEWKVTRPKSLKADRDRIMDFLDKVQSGKVKEFVEDSPKNLSAYGLDRPTEVTFWAGKEKDRTAKTLLLGKKEPDRKGIYAKRGGESSVFLLDEEIGNLLPKSVTDLRDKTVLAADREKIERIEIESPKGKVALAKEGDKWQITAPERLKADESEVGSLLSRLAFLKAREFVAEGAPAGARYLSKPELRLTVKEKDVQNPKVLLLSAAGERRGERLAYAGLAGEGPVMLVDASSMADLAKSLYDLRDRSLLGFFDARDVKKVQFKIAGQALTIERKGESEWQVVSPKKGQAKEGKVNDLLWSLRTAKWNEIVSPKGDDAARFGLDPPQSEITLFKGDGSEMGRLIVGRRDEKNVYVKTHAGPAVYAVESKGLELPKSPEELQG